MEFDELLGSAKWQILEIIGKTPSSPIEIAEKIKTSVAYVSQQLKILEAVGIISKEKTGAFLKGKPRSLYGVKKDMIHMTSLIKGYPVKITIEPSVVQKAMVQIWALENKKHHYTLEKLFWHLEESLDSIDAIYIVGKKVTIVSKDKKINTLIKDFQKKNKSSSSKNKFSDIEVQVVSKIPLSLPKDTHAIYDKNDLGNLSSALEAER